MEVLCAVSGIGNRLELLCMSQRAQEDDKVVGEVEYNAKWRVCGWNFYIFFFFEESDEVVVYQPIRLLSPLSFCKRVQIRMLSMCSWRGVIHS